MILSSRASRFAGDAAPNRFAPACCLARFSFHFLCAFCANGAFSSPPKIASTPVLGPSLRTGWCVATFRNLMARGAWLMNPSSFAFAFASASLSGARSASGDVGIVCFVSGCAFAARARREVTPGERLRTRRDKSSLFRARSPFCSLTPRVVLQRYKFGVDHASMTSVRLRKEGVPSAPLGV